MPIKKIKLEAIAFVITAALLTFCILLSYSTQFANQQELLSRAITLDLLIVIPIVYFMLISRTQIPNYTVITVLIIGVIVGSFIIPKENQALLSSIKSIAIPIIEIAVISYLIYSVRKISKQLNAQGLKQNDFYDNLLVACAGSFPGKTGKLFATEIGIFYYLFIGKGKPPKKHEFTYHKKSGTPLTINVFIVLIIIEIVVAHLLIANWNTTAAWIMSFLGAYTCLQVASLSRSIKQRYIQVNEETETLKLRYGSFAQVEIALDDIHKIEKSKKELPSKNGFIKLSPLDMLDTHNLIIHVNKAYDLEKIYGFKSSFQSIGIHVDEPDLFLNSLELK